MEEIADCQGRYNLKKNGGVSTDQRVQKCEIYNFTPCIRVPKCSAGAPITVRPSWSSTSNVGIAHLTDHHHHGWNVEAFLCPVV